MEKLPLAVRVRELRSGDSSEIKTVVSLINQSYRGTGNWTNESAIVRGLRTTHSALSAELESFVVLVAVADDFGIVGCVKTGLAESCVVGELGSGTGYVGGFAVDARVGGRGVGGRLLRKAEELCRARGAWRVVMDVLAVREELIKWYFRCGYKDTARVVDAKPFIEAKGEVMLVSSVFTLLEKRFCDNERLPH